MSDYSFLRTGLGAGGAGEAEGELTKRLVSLCVALVAKAGETAAVYAVHAGRQTVTRDDVTLALQYQSKTFFDEVTEEEVMEAREEVNAAYDASSTSGEDEEEAVETAEEEQLEWTKSGCTCKICAGMNDASETWDDWEPEDEVLLYLKRMTNKYMESSK